MKYLPFENVTYQTKLESEEVLDRLASIIEPTKSFRMGMFGSGNYKSYEGSIDGSSFKMKRIISYRNSFLPIIKGTVDKDYEGTQIQIKMRLHIFVIVFMFVWFGGVILGCLATLTMMFSSEGFHPMTLIPYAMLIFGYALITGGFKYESIKSKKFLAKLFEADMELRY